MLPHSWTKKSKYYLFRCFGCSLWVLFTNVRFTFREAIKNQKILVWRWAILGILEMDFKKSWFFGLFSSFGTKKIFENFSPWKFLNPHIYGQIFMIVGFLGWIFLLWTLFTPKFNSVNQQSDPVSSQLSFQFSYAGLWSWEKIKPAKLAFDNI